MMFLCVLCSSAYFFHEVLHKKYFSEAQLVWGSLAQPSSKVQFQKRIQFHFFDRPLLAVTPPVSHWQSEVSEQRRRIDFLSFLSFFVCLRWLICIAAKKGKKRTRKKEKSTLSHNDLFSMDDGMDTLFGAVVSSSKRSSAPQIIALVGGGGKTTLAFALASQAAGVGGLRVVVTTTTKMMLPRFSDIKCGAVEVDDCPVVLRSDDADDAAAIEAVRSLFLTGTGSDSESGHGSCSAGNQTKKSGFVFVAAAIDPTPKYKGRRCLGVDASFPMALIDAGACDLVVVEADG